MSVSGDDLSDRIRACRLCQAFLPLPPKPVFQLHTDARILIAGQAPGLKAHESGRPFDDASGQRLRNWMGVSEQTFYDQTKVAILPMGFCYPGKGRSGDLPPRPECAQAWRDGVLASLKHLQLILVIGRYALDWHLPDHQGRPLADVVSQGYRNEQGIFPLPHPSPRNNRWLKQHPWFEESLLPGLREQVTLALQE
ncbi:uracil-DNA glycosylase family protein [Gynuella sunshinyii]|uniref:Uracil-DNA glycosylase n=1 Tax=Gynuella sunshinyii YC6258 TaxID=1445510 RepID=A0A0C5VPN0_9GAMM|nr:uracil-DNA glycosylase family protein [Gynuella sunshinyii]AJQ96196.1 uracil-DNA glycosylase [Gynuella sunshinyii YC6258]